MKMTLETLGKKIATNSVLNVMYNLAVRWIDEKGFEDFNTFTHIMANKVKEELGDEITNVKGTQRPFGLKFQYDGVNYHLFLKNERNYVRLSLKKV